MSTDLCAVGSVSADDFAQRLSVGPFHFDVVPTRPQIKHDCPSTTVDLHSVIQPPAGTSICSVRERCCCELRSL
jgi:hypothetical protein